ncbi:MAG: PTS sugar transporter subunit IIA [Endomicrobium sp.]|jgi:PTS system mannose-specific IIA component|nr:PTS sugar transporter subunit IIA [Endomicrobium sp.]
MIKIIVAAHGGLASEFVNVAAAISGNQSNLYFVERSSSDSLEQMRLRIISLLRDVSDKDGVLILADMFGGTPCNAAMRACADLKVEVISGVNLPMILSAVMLSKTHANLSELADKALIKGQKSISNIRLALEEAHQASIYKGIP